MKKTKVFTEEFMGKMCYTIWNVDENGEKVGKAPIFSCGKVKASAISNHIEELHKFVAENK